MQTVDLSIYALCWALLLLVLPISFSFFFGLHLIRRLLYAVARMSIQLVLIGLFLNYLFVWNNPWINMAWFLFMIVVAVFSVIKSSELCFSKLFVPTLLSFSAATLMVVFYLNSMVISLTDIFDARYLIVVGGMLLGNSLRGNILGISTFYTRIKNDRERYLLCLSFGATRYEALIPYLRESIQLALKPTLAAMITMGIVSLPGMMTGVILGGASPGVAIKYQIMILIAIIVSTMTSVIFTLLLTMHLCFDRYGLLTKNLFRNDSAGQL